MTTLADILAMGNGGLPPVDQFNPCAHALLVPQSTYEVAMAAQEQNRPPDWPHLLKPVVVSGDIYWGIGADVLKEALPPFGLMQHVFSHLPPELAATVTVISYNDFVALLPPPSIQS